MTTKKTKISYIKLEELAGNLKKDIEKMEEHALALRNEKTALIGGGELAGVWEGDAASAFDSAFYKAFYDVFAVTRTLSIYQQRLERASQAYAAVDKEAKSIAENIEKANWAVV